MLYLFIFKASTEDKANKLAMTHCLLKDYIIFVIISEFKNAIFMRTNIDIRFKVASCASNPNKVLHLSLNDNAIHILINYYYLPLKKRQK